MCDFLFIRYTSNWWSNESSFGRYDHDSAIGDADARFHAALFHSDLWRHNNALLVIVETDTLHAAANAYNVGLWSTLWSIRQTSSTTCSSILIIVVVWIKNNSKQKQTIINKIDCTWKNDWMCRANDWWHSIRSCKKYIYYLLYIIFVNAYIQQAFGQVSIEFYFWQKSLTNFYFC